MKFVYFWQLAIETGAIMWNKWELLKCEVLGVQRGNNAQQWHARKNSKRRLLEQSFTSDLSWPYSARRRCPRLLVQLLTQ